jgi:phosphoglycerate dehydrogenase-like enzyme
MARGGVIDEAALIDALRHKRIAGAALDVFSTEPLPQDSPLWTMDNVIISPRLGGLSDIYVEQVMPIVKQNLAAWLRGDRAALVNHVRG